MNIPARITTRKVVYAFIYSHIVQHNPFNIQIRNVQPIDKNGLPARESDIHQVAIMDDSDLLDYCIVIVQNFFSYKKTPDIDMDYLKKMIKAVIATLSTIATQVNNYTNTFSFEKMDISDQALFVLAVTEFQALQTPKEILLNEMVELAKRYGDKGSSKLINGVLHKLFADLQGQNTAS